MNVTEKRIWPSVPEGSLNTEDAFTVLKYFKPEESEDEKVRKALKMSTIKEREGNKRS